jgi:hypothetical protein
VGAPAAPRQPTEPEFRTEAEALDDDVVHPAAAAVHGDADTRFDEDLREARADELVALIRIEDRRAAEPAISSSSVSMQKSAFRQREDWPQGPRRGRSRTRRRQARRDRQRIGLSLETLRRRHRKHWPAPPANPALHTRTTARPNAASSLCEWAYARPIHPCSTVPSPTASLNHNAAPKGIHSIHKPSKTL